MGTVRISLQPSRYMYYILKRLSRNRGRYIMKKKTQVVLFSRNFFVSKCLYKLTSKRRSL